MTPPKPTIDGSHEFPTRYYSTSGVISDPVAFYEAKAQYWEDAAIWWDTYQLKAFEAHRREPRIKVYADLVDYAAKQSVDCRARALEDLAKATSYSRPWYSRAWSGFLEFVGLR